LCLIDISKIKRNYTNQSNETSDNIRSRRCTDTCVVATLAARAHTNATWRMQHLDGHAAWRVITVASSVVVVSRRRPVVVEEVTDVDEATFHSSAVTVAEASSW